MFIARTNIGRLRIRMDKTAPYEHNNNKKILFYVFMYIKINICFRTVVGFTNMMSLSTTLLLSKLILFTVNFDLAYNKSDEDLYKDEA